MACNVSCKPTLSLLAAAGLLLSNSRVLADTLTWNTSGNSTIKDGSGTWNATNTNWWDGAANTAWVDNSDALIGSGGVGGTITLSGLTPTVNSLTFGNYTTTSYTIGTGTINLANAATSIAVNGSAGRINAILAGNGQGLVKSGTGDLTLANNNTYTGDTVVNAGRIYARSTSAIPGGTGKGNVTFNAGAALDFWVGSGTTFSINGLSGAGRINIAVTAGQTLRLGNNNANGNFSGNLTQGSGNVGNLQKYGNGTQTLSGTNTYTGTTTISAGTLLINGNQSAATGAVSVAGGATLGGSGTLGGNTTVNGILSPGDGSGILTLNNNLTINATATSLFEGGDAVNVQGALTLNDNWTLRLDTPSSWQLGGSMTLFTFGTPGATLNLNPTLVDNTGLGGSVSLSQVGNSIVLNGYSAVPEPTTWALLAGSLITIALLRRRRNL